MPSSIDLKLEQAAAARGISMDALVNAILSNGVGPSSPPVAGLWSSPLFQSIGTITPAQNEARAIPWDLKWPTIITALAIGVTTLSATGVMRVGVFADDGSGSSPGALITDFGTITEAAVANNLQSAAGSTGLLQPQRVWLVGRQEVTGATAVVQSGQSPMSIWQALNTAANNFCLSTTGANAFSTGWPLGGSPSAVAAAVLIRAKAN